MKNILISLLFSQLLVLPVLSQSNQSGSDPAQVLRSKLLLLPEAEPELASVDWLIETPIQTAMLTRSGEEDLIISNGLISRTFRLFPNVSSHSLKNLVTGEEFIRSPRAEAELIIDGVFYPVGGMEGQPEQGYFLTEWLDQMQALENAFVLVDFEVKELKEAIPWEKKRWIPSSQWEREGLELVFH